MLREATLSPCGQYRYDLTRRWGEGEPFALWVMLNPSTADGTEDDPTIRRIIDFTRRQDLDGLVVVNLYALRSPKPSVLMKHPRPVGERNDETIRACASRAIMVIAAWGGNEAATARVVPVMRLINRAMYCLGHIRHDAPAHPLYLPAASRLEAWRPSCGSPR